MNKLLKVPLPLSYNKVCYEYLSSKIKEINKLNFISF